MSRGRSLFIAAGAAGLLMLTVTVALAAVTLSPKEQKEQLGKAIFFDQNLSLNRNLSCASCHKSAVGFTGPDSFTNLNGVVYQGSTGAFGNLKPPSSAYATLSPILKFVDETTGWVGGNFWNGRATGWTLGNPAAEQAKGPFLNPKEQALPDAACVVYRVSVASYPVSYEAVWGRDLGSVKWPSPKNVERSCSVLGGTVKLTAVDRATVNTAYDNIALSIAAYEGSAEVNTYSSKYDATTKGKAQLTVLEQRGLVLFTGKAGCTACHPAGTMASFTDFSYDNLGIPVNPDKKNSLDAAAIDGLGGFLESAGYSYIPEMGKQKVPTLRNVALGATNGFVKAYGHNGYFKSLEGIVHFYNTRDVLDRCPGPYTEAQALKAKCWPAPEYAATVNRAQLGNLGLNPSEEAAIVAYLRTLSDGYQR